MPDPITLYSRNPRIVKAITELLAPRRVVTSRDIPSKADVLVTMGQLGPAKELFAGSLHAMCVVLPEGGPWLAERIDRYPVLCGADLANAAPEKRRR